MIPDELYKRRRRHNNTPESILLIIANFIVVSVSIPVFTTRTHINWFFWVVIGLLAIYNFFTIRRNREEYNRITIIAYIVSDIVLVVLFFVFKGS
jgi:cell division protein FtsW (lipid II flippase)